MSLFPLLKTTFTLSDESYNLERTLSKKFAADEDSERLSIVLTKQNYLLGFIPVGSQEICTDLYTGFKQAKDSVISRQRDNTLGVDKETRTVYGAVMGFIYGRMLNDMTADEKAALPAADIALITEGQAQIKKDFSAVYDDDAKRDVRNAVFKLFIH